MREEPRGRGFIFAINCLIGNEIDKYPLMIGLLVGLCVVLSVVQEEVREQYARTQNPMLAWLNVFLTLLGLGDLFLVEDLFRRFGRDLCFGRKRRD
jgi:hypothetical protein